MKKAKQDTSKIELSFYEELGIESLNHEEFKNNAAERLKLLRRIENNIKDLSLVRPIEEDTRTHFCLKLLCAQSKWSSTWFINLETQLFKIRITRDLPGTNQFFLEKIWPHLNIEDNIDFNTFYSLRHHNPRSFDKNIKIHFTKCSEILAKRSHKMKSGYFDMDQEIIGAFVVNEFRRRLEDTMSALYEKIVMESDERLIKLNKEVFFDGSSNQNTASKDIFDSSNLFPLCIKGLIQKFQTEKHLKYNDRQTLCLFFKDIGMSLNDCLNYFRSQFKCTPEQFNKEYSYSIRHNYGLEGKKANYGCFSCNKIIGSVNDANSFGCPFVKNHPFVRANTDIEDLSKEPQKCCGQVGAKTIGKEFETPFYTPADYFRLLHKESLNQQK